MECGDVAEADDPLGRSLDYGKRQAVDELDGAIATTVTEDGLDGRVAERPTEVADAFGNGSGIFSIDNLTYVGTDDGFESPGTQEVGRLLDILHRSEVRGRDKCHLVACLEVVGLDASLHILVRIDEIGVIAFAR